jgi:hypothetical protein
MSKYDIAGEAEHLLIWRFNSSGIDSTEELEEGFARDA